MVGQRIARQAPPPVEFGERFARRAFDTLSSNTDDASPTPVPIAAKACAGATRVARESRAVVRLHQLAGAHGDRAQVGEPQRHGRRARSSAPVLHRADEPRLDRSTRSRPAGGSVRAKLEPACSDPAARPPPVPPGARSMRQLDPRAARRHPTVTAAGHVALGGSHANPGRPRYKLRAPRRILQRQSARRRAASDRRSRPRESRPASALVGASKDA